MIIGECASEHLKLTIEEKKSQFDRENLDHSLFSFVPFCSSMVEIFYQMFTRNLYLFVSLLFSFAHFYIGVCQLNYTNAHVVCSIESIELGICKVCPVFNCFLLRCRNNLVPPVRLWSASFPRSEVVFENCPNYLLF